MKKNPQEIAEKLVARQRRATERAVEQLSDIAIGKMALKLLRDRDSVSIEDLVAAFQDIADKRASLGDDDLSGMQARACIRLLRSLRTETA